MHVTAENARSMWQEAERWTHTTRPVSRAAVSGERGVVERILSCSVANRRRRGDLSLADASLDRRRQNAYKSPRRGAALRTHGAPTTPGARAARRGASVRPTPRWTRRDCHAVL